MSLRRRVSLTAAALAATLGLGACGEDDFENEDRPPAPIEISARISDEDISISPSMPPTVGAGLATITISNQSSDDVQLDFTGPSERSTNPIPAGGVAIFKLDLAQGDYRIEPDVSSIAAASLSVGSERPSAQNELLLP